MKEYGIRYAPHRCKHFCCGDCTIDMLTCMVTYDECNKQEKELKQEIERTKQCLTKCKKRNT